MCECLGSGAGCSSLALRFHEPWRFLTSQWQNPVRRSVGYVTYRVIIAAFFFTWTLVDMSTYRGGNKAIWMLHVTNWCKLLVVTDTLLQAIFTLHYQFFKLRKLATSTEETTVSFSSVSTYFYGVEWLFTNLCANFALVTANVVFIDPSGVGGFGATRYLCNVLYVLVDRCVQRQPMFMGHVFYSLLLYMLYAASICLYGVLDGSQTIDGVNWSRPTLVSGYATIGALLIILSHLLLWLMTKLRELVYACVSDRAAVRISARAPEYGATERQLEATPEQHPAATTETTSSAPQPQETN